MPIEAENRQAVPSERSEAGPAALNMLDRPVDDTFETIDRGRNIDLFRRRVAWVRFDLVMRAEPDRTIALALEVETALRIVDQRQVSKTGPSHSQLNHGAALGLDAQGLNTGRFGDPVRPGARRIHENRCD